MKEIKENTTKLVKIFGVNYELKLVYKRVKNPKLNLKEKEIEISLPSKYKKINNNSIIEMLLEKMYEAIANKELDTIMEKLELHLNLLQKTIKY